MKCQCSFKIQQPALWIFRTQQLASWSLGDIYCLCFVTFRDLEWFLKAKKSREGSMLRFIIPVHLLAKLSTFAKHVINFTSR